MPPTKMNKDRHTASPWPTIKSRVPQVEEMLMSLPPCNVWIHEKQIHHLCKVPEGPSFGQRKSLNCIIKGIDKGYISGRDKVKLMMQNHVPSFDS